MAAGNESPPVNGVKAIVHEWQIQKIFEELSEIKGDLKELRREVREHTTTDAVRDEKIANLERSVGNRTTGGMAAVLIGAMYAAYDFFLRKGSP